MNTATIEQSTTIDNPARVRKARKTAEEKRARATEKKQSNLRVSRRAYFKATGRVLVEIEDRNGKTPEMFHVTIIDGAVTGCCNVTTGATCSGREWSGHCMHGDRALQYEGARDEQLHDAAIVAPLVLGESFAADLPAHVEDEAAQDASRNVSEQLAAFSAEYAEKQSAWDAMSIAERKASLAGEDAPIVPNSCDICGAWTRRALCSVCSGSAAA